MLIKFDVSEVHMVDMGQVAGGFQFEAECVDKEQKISQVRIITNDITTNDKLDSVTVYWVDDLLHMHVWIDRYVYDEWWNVPDSCLTKHEIRFKLHGLPVGTYDIDLRVGDGGRRIGLYEIR